MGCCNEPRHLLPTEAQRVLWDATQRDATPDSPSVAELVAGGFFVAASLALIGVMLFYRR